MATEMVTLPAEAIPSLRRMLAIGLASLAEIERVQDNKMFTGGQAGDGPLHPTGAHETGEFAAALLWLDMATPVAEAAA